MSEVQAARAVQDFLYRLGIEMEYPEYNFPNHWIFRVKGARLDCTICDKEGYFILQEEVDGELRDGERMECPACKGVGDLTAHFTFNVSSEQLFLLIRELKTQILLTEPLRGISPDKKTRVL